MEDKRASTVPPVPIDPEEPPPPGPYQAALAHLDEAKSWAEKLEDWDDYYVYAMEQVHYALTYLDPRNDPDNEIYHVVHELVQYMTYAIGQLGTNVASSYRGFHTYLAAVTRVFTNLNEGRKSNQDHDPVPYQEPYAGCDNDAKILREWAEKGAEDGND